VPVGEIEELLPVVFGDVVAALPEMVSDGVSDRMVGWRHFRSAEAFEFEKCVNGRAYIGDAALRSLDVEWRMPVLVVLKSDIRT